MTQLHRWIAALIALCGAGFMSVPVASAEPSALAAHDATYPFYMPMKALAKPAIRLFITCEASRRAGKEVYVGADAASLYGRATGGFEFVYEATDRAGHACVYPFSPWIPQIAGPLQGTQYILRSSVPGHRVIFRNGGEWATIDLRLFDIGRQRMHFEMRDIDLDFPGAVQPMGALHLEAFGGTSPGLFTAVIRRCRIYGGKNAVFVPGGQTMLFVEDSTIAGNVGGNADQEHTTYINGTLVTHLRNSSWAGQHAWSNVASGHQLKDKAYLRIYENVTVSNRPVGTPASAMPLIDASAFGFTWANNLHLVRQAPLQAPRDALVDLRTEMRYGAAANYPWSVLAGPGWRMPPDPLAALDKLYLSVFLNTSIDSFRTEPYVFALRNQGTAFEPGTDHIAGNDTAPRAWQRAVSIAFHTTGRVGHAYSRDGWTFSDPKLPRQSEWIIDRDAFIRHALGLIGR